MATRRIREFLDGNNAKYSVISHSPAYTAQEVAASVHIPGRSLAKAVIVDIDGRLAMAVVPASRDVDMNRLRKAVGGLRVQLADKQDFASRFEGCQLGTVPPFGNVFGMETYMDRELTKEEHIAFNAGTHTDVIVMEFNVYLQLAHPKLVEIAVEPIQLAGV